MATSVTAERWLPLLEVPPPGLPAWLAKRQAQGWALVGLEQASAASRWPHLPALVVVDRLEQARPQTQGIWQPCLWLRKRDWSFRSVLAAVEVPLPGLPAWLA